VIPVLHVVTNDLVIGRPWFTDRARGVMQAAGKLGALHLRARLVSAARLYELARELLPVQERTGCWVVINDRLDVALTAGASGAQLTTRSIDVADARRMVGSLPLGASVHSVSEATAAASSGADWVVAGHIYPTPSHAGAPGLGLELVRDVATTVHVPCIAIGGVLPEHVPTLLAAGAYGVATISGIWGANDAELAASDYVSRYERAHGS
jgi:thiamine-phosphate diphosphorylase